MVELKREKLLNKWKHFLHCASKILLKLATLDTYSWSLTAHCKALHWRFPRHFFHSAAHPQTWHFALTFHCKHLAGQIKMYNRLTLGSAGSDSGYLAYLFSSRMWTHTQSCIYDINERPHTCIKGLQHNFICFVQFFHWTILSSIYFLYIFNIVAVSCMHFFFFVMFMFVCHVQLKCI